MVNSVWKLAIYALGPYMAGSLPVRALSCASAVALLAAVPGTFFLVHFTNVHLVHIPVNNILVGGA